MDSMAKSKKEKEEDKESKVLYLKVSSVEDICRLACNFDFTAETLMLSKFPEGSRIIAFGEKAEDTQIAYYANTTDVDGIIMYEPATEDTKERAAFTNRTDQPNKYYISVLRADLSQFPLTDVLDEKSIHIIRVANPIDLVAAAIKRAAKDETISNIYSFSSDGKKVLAAFNVLEALSNDKLIFYYSILDKEKLGNFARYDYRNNSLDFANSMGDHAYMYAKVINLSAPFPFMV